MARVEIKILEGWKLKLGLLMAIVVPTVTATGALFDLKSKIIEREAAVNQRISEVELKTEQNKADKNALDEVRRDVKVMRDDLVEIKTLLKRR